MKNTLDKKFIKPVGLENNENRVTVLYGVEGNEIGRFVEESLHYGVINRYSFPNIHSFIYKSINSSSVFFYDGDYLHATIDRINDKYHIVNDQQDNKIQSVKASDQYNLNIIDNNKNISVHISSTDSGNIKHDALNEIIEENDLCYQFEIANKDKEALCKELDE